MGKIKDEIRRRVPRLTMSLVITIIFLIVSVVIQQTHEISPLSTISIPGLGMDASSLLTIITLIIAGIFLIRALSDALVLGDIITDIIVRRLGIKEERTPKRAARELIYIIAIVLIVIAILPAINTYIGGDVGSWLTIITIYLALGIIIVLIYDIGRTIYKIIEQSAESLADRLSKEAEGSV